MLLKTIDARNLYFVLKKLLDSNQVYPSKFVFRIARNMNTLKPLAEAYEKAIDVNRNEYLREYSQARSNLLESICVKDRIGKPLNDNGKYVFDPPDAGSLALENLAKNYPDLEQEAEKFSAEIKEIGDGEEDIDLLTIKEEQLPDSLPANIMESLLFIIE